jgi:hypothetical protein
MEPVISWAFGFGLCIFGLGMISAVASRKQRKQKQARHALLIQKPEETRSERKDDGTRGLSMAAGGTGNVYVGKDDFAPISGSSS